MYKYNSSNIKILKGLDAIKKRPGMYIGNTDDGSGLHHMIFEIIDNSIDEVLEGHCNEINIKIYKDNSVSINDNGRGIPIDNNNEYNKSAAELIMTTLHSGGKFDNNSYKISGGLHGVGISVVNALSSKFILIINKDNTEYIQNYLDGNPEIPIIKNNINNKTGTFIKFWPNYKIFTNNNNFNYNIIRERLLELSFLNSNILITLENETNNKIEKFDNSGGLKSFMKHILKDKILIHQNCIYINTIKNNIKIEILLQWINTSKYTYYCFTNNIKQKDGGSHLSGLKSGITKTINFYLEKEIKKKLKFSLIGDDIREGLISIISIKLFDPKFSSQTKDKLISSEVKCIIENVINDKLIEFFIENITDSKLIINKIIQSSLARDAARKAKEIIKKKEQIELNNLIGKLSICQEKNPKISELFLVEGDSAGGSAKQARNRSNQAVLSLKGKIINVEKSNIDKIMFSKEITSIISTIGCNIEKNYFNINKLKYHKIIIMTDADVDGSHIRTLLLTFFYRYIPEIIKNGYLYIAQPPLYKIIKGKNEKYIKDDNELIKYKINYIIENISLHLNLNNCNIDKLKNLLYEYVNIKTIIFNLKNIFPYDFLFYIMKHKKISIEILNSYKFLYDYIKNILDKISTKNLKYNFKLVNNLSYFIISQFNNGINYSFKIDNIFFTSYEYEKIIKFGINLRLLIIDNNLNIKFNDLYKLIDFLYNESIKGCFIHRYKGLGEMNPSQLWDTTMNPKNRNLLKISIINDDETNKLFNILMGESVLLRKIFIEKNALYVENIDI